MRHRRLSHTAVKVLRGKKPITGRPGASLEPLDFDHQRRKLEEKYQLLFRSRSCYRFFSLWPTRVDVCLNGADKFAARISTPPIVASMYFSLLEDPLTKRATRRLCLQCVWTISKWKCIGTHWDNREEGCWIRWFRSVLVIDSVSKERSQVFDCCRSQHLCLLFQGSASLGFQSTS